MSDILFDDSTSLVSVNMVRVPTAERRQRDMRPRDRRGKSKLRNKVTNRRFRYRRDQDRQESGTDENESRGLMLFEKQNRVSSLYFSTDKPQSSGKVKEIPDINSSRDAIKE